MSKLRQLLKAGNEPLKLTLFAIEFALGMTVIALGVMWAVLLSYKLLGGLY